jgi:uncharacterized protein involved in exopolysaccharide biosynthesis
MSPPPPRDSAAEQFGLADVVAILKRRARLMAGITIGLTTILAIVIARLPDVYVARSVVYIEPGRMPKSFERAGAVVPKLSQVVGVLRQEILSRDVLRELINELDLYERKVQGPVEFNVATMATATAQAPLSWRERLFYKDPIERARNDIKIEIVKRYGDEYIEISIRARLPELASRAVDKIADLLAQKNRDLRIRRAQDVRVFLDSELAKVGQRFQEDEATLVRFRDESRESLPESEGQLLERLFSMKVASMDRRRRIDEANLRRSLIEQRLAALTNRPVGADGIAPVADTGAESRAAIELELRRTEASERDLAGRRGPRHPDLVRARAQIDVLRKRLAEMGGPLELPAIPGPLPPGPLAQRTAETPADALAPAAQAAAAARKPGDAPESVEQLTAELAALSRFVETLTRDQEIDLKEIERLDARKAAIGSTRVKLLKLESAFEESEKSYRELLNDRFDVDRFLVAADAMQVDQLRTIDTAEAPTVPAEPNRPLLFCAGLAAALAAAFGVAFLVDRKGRTFRTRTEIEEELGVMVIAVLPDLEESVPAPPQEPATSLQESSR